MDEKQAREILQPLLTEAGLQSTDSTSEGYFNWEKGENTIYLDGTFMKEQLSAIVWWMENK